MRWPHFLLMNAFGGICWAAIFGFGAYLLGEQIKRVAGPVGLIMLVVAVIFVTAGFVFFRQHEKELEERADAAIPHLKA